jgi:hypothetical protein
MDNPRPNEPLKDLLLRRERELVEQIASLRNELEPRESELTEVRQAMVAIGLSPRGALSGTIVPNPPPGGWAGALSARFLPQKNSFADIQGSPPALLSSVEQPTIKQLVFRSFTDHFHDGATPAELRAHIRDTYGREIDRTSMSPQLARMRDEGILVPPMGTPDEGKWRLNLRGTIEDAAARAAEEPRKRDWYSPKK